MPKVYRLSSFSLLAVARLNSWSSSISPLGKEANRFYDECTASRASKSSIKIGSLLASRLTSSACPGNLLLTELALRSRLFRPLGHDERVPMNHAIPIDRLAD